MLAAERQRFAAEMVHLLAVTSHADARAFCVMKIARPAADGAFLVCEARIDVALDVVRLLIEREARRNVVREDEVDEEADEVGRYRHAAVRQREHAPLGVGHALEHEFHLEEGFLFFHAGLRADAVDVFVNLSDERIDFAALDGRDVPSVVEYDEAVFVLPQERAVDARHAGLDGERAVRIDVHDLSCDLLLDHVMRPRVSRARLRGSSRGARLRMPSYRSRSICVPWPRRSAALPCRSRPCVSSLH